MTAHTDSALLTGLDSMDLDVDGAQLPFSRRLARDNGWSHDFACRVIREYKRFVYLAMTAGHPVTPSDEVDQAWHLHLAYTRHYWNVMCDEILGAPLHHGPTLGGSEESAKYHDWYSRTLESYEAAFGELPPSDVWPAPSARFDGVDAFQRINTKQLLLVPIRRAQAALLGGLTLVLAGCSVAGELSWRAAIGVCMAVIAFAFIGAYLWRKVSRSDSAGAGGCGGVAGGGGGKSSSDSTSDGGGDAGASGCSGCGGCGG